MFLLMFTKIQGCYHSEAGGKIHRPDLPSEVSVIGKELSRLYHYDEWATNKLIEAVEKVDASRLQKDLGTSFGSLYGTLVHIYGAQLIWLGRWKGFTPSALPKPEDIPTLPELKSRWTKLRTEFREFLNSKTDDQLQEPFSYTDLKGNSWSERHYQQIQHVLFHSMYHRGQVVTLLRQLGEVPPQTDLIAYYRNVK
jgi:uncharacterized damage-inducible protein DinB